VGHVARIITMTVSCQIFVAETEMKRLQCKHKRGLEDTMKLDLKTWICNVDWIRLIHGKVKWLLLPKAVSSGSIKGEALKIP
jgi:hypothetical protein